MTYSAATAFQDVYAGKSLLREIEDDFPSVSSAEMQARTLAEFMCNSCTDQAFGGIATPASPPGLRKYLVLVDGEVVPVVGPAARARNLPSVDKKVGHGWISTSGWNSADPVPPATMTLASGSYGTGTRMVVLRDFDISTPVAIPVAPSALQKCLALLSSRMGLLTIAQRQSLERQLTGLLQEDDGSVAVSVLSLDTLISFLAMHRPSVHPNIAVVKDGRFTASWLPARDKKLTLTFETGGGTWVAVNLTERKRASGAFVTHSLDGITPAFRQWMMGA